MTTPQRPLTGLTVLELGQIYNGPYCALLLAYHGAEVIKVEPPHGDVLRRMDRSPGGASYPFLMLNANKKGISLDLKDPRGRELLLRLAERADVIVENFVAGVMDRLGIGYDVVSARNPRIVYASGSGFGSTGPYVGYPAMDFTIQALIGAMAITGYPDNPIKLAGETEPEPAPAPAIGQHTAEVLRERLAMSDAEIAGLRAAGVLQMGTSMDQARQSSNAIAAPRILIAWTDPAGRHEGVFIRQGDRLPGSRS